MTRYLGLWAEMLRLAWQRVPMATTMMIGVCALSVVANAGLALSLRAVIDASVHGTFRMAIVAALAAAVCCGVTVTFQHTVWDLLQLLTDDAGLEIRRRINKWITGIEGLDHLERTDLLDRLDDARTRSWQVSMSLWQLVLAVRSVLQFGVMLLVLGTVSSWLLLLLPFAAVPVWFDQRGKQVVTRAEQRSAETFRLQRHLFQIATRADSGKDIWVAGAGERLARMQAAAWDEVAHLRHRARVRAAGWNFGGWAIFACGFVGALALVSYQAAQGRSTTGDIVMAVIVASGLRQVAQQVVGRMGSTLSTKTAIEAYLWLQQYAAAEEATRKAGNVPVPAHLTTGITFERVTYSYPGVNRRALDDISIHIPTGTVVAVVGEYGSGKTTLVKLLAKFYQPEKGRITVDGTDLAQFDTLSLIHI